MSVSAMYPGTFDPITLGHEDLVRRASLIFDKVVVAIARDTGGKVPMFTFGERVQMAEDALSQYANVEIRGYSGLTVEYARDNGLAVIIRGLRAVSDFEYEFQLANMNRHLTEDVETVFLTPVTGTPSSRRHLCAKSPHSVEMSRVSSRPGSVRR